MKWGFLFGNYVLTVAVLSWLSAQIIKTILNAIRFKKFDLERLVGAGGMPSAHSALVCSMTLAMARKTGVASSEFALAFLLASIVMYDAMGVRRAAGEQAKIINRYFLNRKKTSLPSEAKDKVKSKLKKKTMSGEEQYKKLKEYLGHTPLEVMCGALLGILIAMLVPVQ